ncbi:hypothetical protein [Sphingomonas colocasiae]|uniref:IS1 family transposase n=1 Tax=Sphingomonas colocasiae TaxID=1848973 RepID=A0ABS7PZ92_9SPHN|nr:hypothetical protein [Sphingomonas colocasiae]MBY8823291.1 hypothetical protein [Sphingomonas colocasiae]MBY8826426.1 hypothetical protein [Sphingomonas colocasiae]
MVHPSLRNTLKLACSTPGCGGQQPFTFRVAQTVRWRCSVCNTLQESGKADVAVALEARGFQLPDEPE